MTTERDDLYDKGFDDGYTAAADISTGGIVSLIICAAVGGALLTVIGLMGAGVI